MQQNNQKHMSEMLFNGHNHLGYNSPYYINKNGFLIVANLFPEAINKYDGLRQIDPASVLEVLNKGYMLADRTIIDGIQYAPWLARPNPTMEKWNYEQAPKHGSTDISEKEIADHLFRKVCWEIKSQIGERKQIGVLLSGGMDSRIVAGAIDYIVRNKGLKDLKVTGLTWGNDHSRDVVYAKEIAKRLGWNWKHYKVTANDLLNNIQETAIHGCEYSPIHLHAIPQIRDDNKSLEIIFAGSYGDSVGRAEFSGWKTRKVPDILLNISNPCYLMADPVYRASIGTVYADVEKYRKLFPRSTKSAEKELDFQVHYMRRMLNPCMKTLNSCSTVFYQVFTDPAVYGYMWNIALCRRTDFVYECLSKKYFNHLCDIPWARTGLRFGKTKGRPDLFQKKHHSYEAIITREIGHYVKEKALSPSLMKMKIFNFSSVSQLFSLTKKSPKNSINYLSKLVWLAALSEMIDLYDIKPSQNTTQHKARNHIFQIATTYYFNTLIRSQAAPVLKKYLQKYL